MGIKFVIIALAIISCGTKTRQAEKSTSPLGELLLKKQAYLDEFSFHQDSDGWILAGDCDAALFSGLASAFAPSVALLRARDEGGKWYRRPSKDCYPNHSGSSISRDMLVGIMFGLYFQGDIDALDSMRRYGKANKWVMGSGSLDRTFFTPNFQDTLYRLSGKDYKGPPYLWVDPIKDHQRHVVALNIILRGEAQKKIDDSMFSVLGQLLKSDPDNALFQYGYHRFSDGDQRNAIKILSDETLFPQDGPGGERCRRWLWERHFSKRNSCPTPEVNTGADFLFMMFLLERSIDVVDTNHDYNWDHSGHHAKQTRTDLLLR